MRICSWTTAAGTAAAVPPHAEAPAVQRPPCAPSPEWTWEVRAAVAGFVPDPAAVLVTASLLCGILNGYTA